ncbi:MAG: cation:proton antiporter [Anaerolineae bacterium]
MESVFTAASHHDILVLMVQLTILLLSARLLGEVAQRLNQPSVVGEILAGILLGPSLLSGIFPIVNEWIVPHTPVQGYLLELVGLIGVMFLLLITGIETDLVLIQRQARSAISVAIGGLILPLLMGFGLGQVIPDDLLVNTDDRFVFSLFLAIAMSISAIPVVAKVLMDLNLTRRNAGQTILAAAMIDDTTGWIMLSIVVALASGAAITAGSVLMAMLRVLGFLAISFTVGYWLVKRLLYFTQDEIRSRDKVLTLVMVLAFAWGAVAQALNLEAILGAFVVGILFSQMPRLNTEVVHQLESMALGVFAPIFFAIAGLKVDIISLLQPDLLVVMVAVVVVATVCKVAGVYLGARLLGGQDHWSALFFGAGLNARGSMEIIIATIGLSLGILSQEMFSIIVVMAVATSLMAPAALRWALSHMETDAEEAARLEMEALNKQSLVANLRRVMIPVRVREFDNSATHMLEARLLEQISRHANIEITLLTVATAGDAAQCGEYLNRLSAHFPQKGLQRKVLTHISPSQAILEEAHKGYDLIILGATEKRPEADTLFSTMVDTIVRLAPCPVLVVHAAELPETWQPKRILVPTTGATSGRAAAQVAFAIADADTEVVILNVVQESSSVASEHITRRARSISEEIVRELSDLGRVLGVQSNGIVRRAADVEGAILGLGEDADLIVLGTSVRPASERLYLGRKVEHILMHSTVPVLIVNA